VGLIALACVFFGLGVVDLIMGYSSGQSRWFWLTLLLDLNLLGLVQSVLVIIFREWLTSVYIFSVLNLTLLSLALTPLLWF
jgi:hypothetical protein